MVPCKGDAELENKPNVKTIINWWLITYGIVGTQMAWIMRPFIGNPEQPFSIFRPQESNFYITVFNLFSRMLSGH